MKLHPLALAIALAFVLTGCKTVPEKVTTVYVKVKEPCIEREPTKPTYRFGKGEKPKTDAEKAMILADDFEKAEQYGTDWKAAAAGCIAPQQPK